MNKSIILIIVTTFFICLSCEDKSTNFSSSNPELNMYDLKKEIVYDKNIESYGMFLDMSANDSLNYEPLSFSILLADEDNSKANLMVFVEMVQIFNKNKFSIEKFSELSKINRDFAFYHLNKSAKMGHISGQMYLEEIYRKGIGIKKSKIKADSIMNILLKRKGYKIVDK